MHILLDSHAVIWYFEDSVSMNMSAKSIVDNPQNRLFISTASIWEISIKVSLGKLVLPAPVHEVISDYVKKGATLLSVTPKHAMGVQSLPWHHRDPFDRMLIIQAKHEGLTMLTKDEKILQYDVLHVW